MKILIKFLFVSASQSQRFWFFSGKEQNQPNDLLSNLLFQKRSKSVLFRFAEDIKEIFLFVWASQIELMLLVLF
jgi:hypothetical protein